MVETDADLQDLARLFEGLRFPGPDLADGAVEQEGRDFYFYCLDTEESPLSAKTGRHPLFSLLDFSQDWKTGRYRDPRGIYPLLRQIRNGSLQSPWWEDIRAGAGRYRALTEGALILARYGGGELPSGRIDEIISLIRDLSPGQPPKTEEQRLLLTGIVCSPDPGPARPGPGTPQDRRFS
jgi:poly(A) polymerase